MSQNHELFSTNIAGYDLVLNWSPSFAGIGLEILVMLGLVYLYKSHKDSSVAVLFDSVFEKVYDFFTDILGTDEKTWVKSYVIGLFFLILFSNLLGVILEFLAPMFGRNAEGHFILEEYISIPTADLNFNIAMASISVLLILIIQARHLWAGKFIYEFLPVFWKGYLEYKRWNKPAYIDYPLFLLVKLFDIVISVFLGLLEVIGTFAKVISLSFRLFGNMTSWAILLAMLVWGMTALTSSITGYEFIPLFPIVVYAQELLVAMIQALVFPLLVAIFIKVSKAH